MKHTAFSRRSFAQFLERSVEAEGRFSHWLRRCAGPRGRHGKWCVSLGKAGIYGFFLPVSRHGIRRCQAISDARHDPFFVHPRRGCAQRYPHPGYAQNDTSNSQKVGVQPVDRNGDSGSKIVFHDWPVACCRPVLHRDPVLVDFM